MKFPGTERRDDVGVHLRLMQVQVYGRKSTVLLNQL